MGRSHSVAAALGQVCQTTGCWNEPARYAVHCTVCVRERARAAARQRMSRQQAERIWTSGSRNLPFGQ